MIFRVSRIVLLFAAVCLVSFHAKAGPDGETYFIGNSLTWDGRPNEFADMAGQLGLDIEPGHYIRTNSSLGQIWDNRNNMGESYNTFDSLIDGLSQPWDVVTFQPHFGRLNEANQGSFGGDRNTIVDLVSIYRTAQPNHQTRFYIYEGWVTRSTIGQGDWQSVEGGYNDADEFTRSLEYMNQLLAEVRTALPGETIGIIPTGSVFEAVHAAIEAGEIPNLTTPSSIYRDDVHASYSWGRAVAKWTNFATIYGQSPEVLASEFQLTDTERALQAVVWDTVTLRPESLVPEPTTFATLCMGCLLLSRRRKSLA